MEFATVGEFLAMGKHGFYVWLSYGLTAVILLVNILLPLRRRSQLVKDQRRRARRDQHEHPSAQNTPESNPEENSDASQA